VEPPEEERNRDGCFASGTPQASWRDPLDRLGGAEGVRLRMEGVAEALRRHGTARRLVALDCAPTEGNLAGAGDTGLAPALSANRLPLWQDETGLWNLRLLGAGAVASPMARRAYFREENPLCAGRLVFAGATGRSEKRWRWCPPRASVIDRAASRMAPPQPLMAAARGLARDCARPVTDCS